MPSFSRIHVAVLLTLLLQACGPFDDNSSDPSASLPTTEGFVNFGDSVKEASIQVVDLKTGKTSSLQSKTTSGGMFIGAALMLGGDYRIEASNGNLANGSEVNGSMALEIRNYAGEPIYINPVTTLVSRYLSKQPTLSLEQAENAVRLFLGLPGYQNIGIGLNIDTPEFSHRSFRMAMGDVSFNSFIDSLVVEMSKPVGGIHRFPPKKLLQSSVVEDVAVFAGKKLVEGALKQGGSTFAKVLTSFIFGDDGTSKIPEKLDEIQAQLTESQNTLKEMQAQLKNLEDRASNIQLELKSVQYNSGVSELVRTITKVKNLNDQLQRLVSIDPTNMSGDQLKYWNTTRAEFYNSICKIYTEERRFGIASDEFDELLQGKTTGTSLITLLIQGKTFDRTFFNYNDSQDLYAVRRYWETIQAQLYNLVDIYLATGKSEDGCNSTASSKRMIATPGSEIQKEREALAYAFEKRQLEQMARYPTQLVPKDTAIDINRQTMVRTELVLRLATGDYESNGWKTRNTVRNYFTGTWDYEFCETEQRRLTPIISQTKDWEEKMLKSCQTIWSAMDKQEVWSDYKKTYFREDWRLINKEEIEDYFSKGNDSAIRRGWPSASISWGDYAVACDCDRVVRSPNYVKIAGIYIVDSYTITTYIYSWSPKQNVFLENIKDSAAYSNQMNYVIAVRPLNPTKEDYLPK